MSIIGRHKIRNHHLIYTVANHCLQRTDESKSVSQSELKLEKQGWITCWKIEKK